MYFSRVMLKPDLASTALVKIIAGNTYGKHQLLWELFPESQQRPFLYREEFASEQLGQRSKMKGSYIYYLLSAEKPIENGIFQVDTKDYQPQLAVGDILSFRLRANPTVTRHHKRHDIAMDAQRTLLTQLCQSLEFPTKNPKKSDLKQAILRAKDANIDQQLTQILSRCTRYPDRLQTALDSRQRLAWALKSVTEQALEEWLIRQGRKKGFELLSTGAALGIDHYHPHTLPEKNHDAVFHSIDFSGMLRVTHGEVFIQDTLFKGIGPAKGFGCGLMLVKRAYDPQI